MQSQSTSSYLCLGIRPYSLWSNVWFKLLSAAQLISALGRRGIRVLLNLVVATMSRGRPPLDVLPITQAPVRVLRYVWISRTRERLIHSM